MIQNADDDLNPEGPFSSQKGPSGHVHAVPATADEGTQEVLDALDLLAPWPPLLEHCDMIPISLALGIWRQAEHQFVVSGRLLKIVGSESGRAYTWTGLARALTGASEIELVEDALRYARDGAGELIDGLLDERALSAVRLTASGTATIDTRREEPSAKHRSPPEVVAVPGAGPVQVSSPKLASAVGEVRLMALPDFLAVDDPPINWLVDGLFPVNGRVVLSAMAKTGKSTLMNNLVRALVDREAFLGTFDTYGLSGNVALLDAELDPRTMRDWWRAQDLANPSRVHVASLRGAVKTFDVTDDKSRRQWARALSDVGTELLIVDCLRPLLDASGLSEATDFGIWAVGFDDLLKQAGIQHALVVHHSGHHGGRPRGDSRIRDWPDAEWLLTKSSDRAPRSFSAYGRDVDLPMGQLLYEATTHRLTWPGTAPARAPKRGASPAAREEILEVLSTPHRPNDPIRSKNWLQQQLKHLDRQAVRDALDELLAAGDVVLSKGARNAHVLSLRDE